MHLLFFPECGFKAAVTRTLSSRNHLSSRTKRYTSSRMSQVAQWSMKSKHSDHNSISSTDDHTTLAKRHSHKRKLSQISQWSLSSMTSFSVDSQSQISASSSIQSTGNGKEISQFSHEEPMLRTHHSIISSRAVSVASSTPAHPLSLSRQVSQISQDGIISTDRDHPSMSSTKNALVCTNNESMSTNYDRPSMSSTRNAPLSSHDVSMLTVQPKPSPVGTQITHSISFNNPFFATQGIPVKVERLSLRRKILQKSQRSISSDDLFLAGYQSNPQTIVKAGGEKMLPISQGSIKFQSDYQPIPMTRGIPAMKASDGSISREPSVIINRHSIINSPVNAEVEIFDKTEEENVSLHT